MDDQDEQLILDKIADDFLMQCRRGQAPSVEQYASEYPELQQQIRDVLGTLLFIEEHHESNESEPSLKGGFDADLESEPTIDDFRIIRVAGRGGMGVVYEAEQISLARKVALKVLPASLQQDRNAVERFQNEARFAAGLHHSNIVPVYEVGSDPTCFYAMQFIDGHNLDFISKNLKDLRTSHELRRESNSTEDEFDPIAGTIETGLSNTLNMSSVSSSGGKPFYRNVAQLGKQVADAIQYAHQKGIVHRDIKPANLMLDLNGTVWVTDFGLAKTEVEGLTRTGDVIGTLRYMSPERFNGNCDERSDIYSLGLTLYELLVQRSPFESSDRFELIDRIKNEDPIALKKLDPRLPRDLQTIIEKAIEKEPRRRYSTAAELSDDLERFIDGRPIRARQVGPIEKLTLWARKRKALAAALAAISVLLVTGVIAATGAALFFKQQSIKQTELANQNLQLATQNEKEKKAAVSQRDLAKLSEYYADIQLAQQDWNSGQLSRMLRTLKKYRPLGDEKDLRNWEWYYLLSLAHQDQLTIFEHEKSVMQTQWSPDGSQLYSASVDGSLRIWDREGKQLQRIDIPGLERFAISPDGSQVATVGGDSVLRYWDGKTGKLIRGFDTKLSNLTFVHWAAKNPRLVVVPSNLNEVPHVFDSTNDKLVGKPKGYSQRLAFLSPNGKFLATCRMGQRTKIWDVENGKLINEVESELDGDSQTLSCGWYPDGKRFASGHFNTGVRLLEVDLASKFAKPLGRIKNGSTVASVSITADGTKLLTGDRSQLVEVYDVENQKLISRNRGHLGWVQSVSGNPSDGMIASASLDGTIKIWAAEQKNEMETDSPQLAGESEEFSWTLDLATHVATIRSKPDGKVLATIDEVAVNDSFAFFPAYKKAVVRRYPNDIAIFETDTWKELDQLFIDASGSVGNSFYSWAGKYAASTNRNGYVAIVDLEKDTFRRFFAHDARRVGLRLSPDGSQLATIGQGDVKLWDCETGKELATFLGHAPDHWLSVVRWGNSGRYIATSGWDQNVIIWDAAEKKMLHKLEGHQSMPLKIFFSADDSRMMSVGKDTKLWDVKTGRELLSVEEGKGHISAFRSNRSSAEFGLDDSELSFRGLGHLANINRNDDEIMGFEHASALREAKRLLFSDDPTDEEIVHSLRVAQRAYELKSTDTETLVLLANAQLRNELIPDAKTTIELACAAKPDANQASLLRVAIVAASGAATDSDRQSFQELLSQQADPRDHEDSILFHLAAQKLFPKSDEKAPIEFVVNTLEDELNGLANDKLSLREALLASRDGDTIKFEVEGEIKLKHGVLFVDRSVTIAGPGKDKLTVDGQLRSQVFRINDGNRDSFSEVKFSGMTISNGNVDDLNNADAWMARGGAVFSNETLDLQQCTIQNSKAQRGGAIWVNEGSTANIVDCTVTGNFGSEAGGALAICGQKWGLPATAKVRRCTFTQNVAKLVGGAIYNYGNLEVVNSTIDGNTAKMAKLGPKEWSGGGVACSSSPGLLTMAHCTITNNIGGGFGTSNFANLFQVDAVDEQVYPFNESKKAKFTNCIFYGNLIQGQPMDLSSRFCEANITTIVRHCLIGAHDGSLDDKTNILGEDPKLGPLQDNGGSVLTRALQKDSPCINAGQDLDIQFDQRGNGFPRQLSDAESGELLPDIGAIEFGG